MQKLLFINTRRQMFTQLSSCHKKGLISLKVMSLKSGTFSKLKSTGKSLNFLFFCERSKYIYNFFSLHTFLFEFVCNAICQRVFWAYDHKTDVIVLTPGGDTTKVTDIYIWKINGTNFHKYIRMWSYFYQHLRTFLCFKIHYKKNNIWMFPFNLGKCLALDHSEIMSGSWWEVEGFVFFSLLFQTKVR